MRQKVGTKKAWKNKKMTTEAKIGKENKKKVTNAIIGKEKNSRKN